MWYSTIDQEKIKQYPQGLTRYLSIVPNTVLFQAQVTGYSTDSFTGGIYQVNVSAITVQLTTFEDNMIYFGTTAGDNDLGVARLRSSYVSASNVVNISEVSLGKVDLDYSGTIFITVMDAYVPDVRLVRIETSSSGNQIDSFTEYHDYDEVYTNQNERQAPKAQITDPDFADGDIGVKPAGFVDSGQSYRTVRLDASASYGVAYNASTLSFEWFLGDGTITTGSSITPEITATFPVGFRWIRLKAVDNFGSIGWMRWPIWVHDDDNMPLSNIGFQIESHQRNIGTAMTFKVFDDAFIKALRTGTQVCYWEDDHYYGERYRPAGIPDSYIGWISNINIDPRSDRSQASIVTSGVYEWLNSTNSFFQFIVDVITTPSGYNEMIKTTIERVCYYILKEYTTVVDMVNIFMPDIDLPSPGEDIQQASAWAQLNQMLTAYLAEARADSLSGIWLRRDAVYVPTASQSSLPVVLDITADMIKKDNGISVNRRYHDQVSSVKAQGSHSNWGMTPLFYNSIAPGLAVSTSGSEQSMPFQRLSGTATQSELNTLAGQYFSHQNRQIDSITLNLVGIADLFDTAQNQIIRLTYTNTDVGVDFNQALFKLDRCSINHASDGKLRDISITIIPIQQGVAGTELPVDEATLDGNTDLSINLDGDFSLPSIPQISLPPLDIFVPDIGFEMGGQFNPLLPPLTFDFGDFGGEFTTGTVSPLDNWELWMPHEDLQFTVGTGEFGLEIGRGTGLPFPNYGWGGVYQEIPAGTASSWTFETCFALQHDPGPAWWAEADTEDLQNAFALYGVDPANAYPGTALANTIGITDSMTLTGLTTDPQQLNPFWMDIRQLHARVGVHILEELSQPQLDEGATIPGTGSNSRMISVVSDPNVIMYPEDIPSKTVDREKPMIQSGYGIIAGGSQEDVSLSAGGNNKWDSPSAGWHAGVATQPTGPSTLIPIVNGSFGFAWPNSESYQNPWWDALQGGGVGSGIKQPTRLSGILNGFFYLRITWDASESVMSFYGSSDGEMYSPIGVPIKLNQIEASAIFGVNSVTEYPDLEIAGYISTDNFTSGASLFQVSDFVPKYIALATNKGSIIKPTTGYFKYARFAAGPAAASEGSIGGSSVPVDPSRYDTPTVSLTGDV